MLDNECGTLPIEFNEVSVMRRLYRDGESEYYLNRARVRRLDVMELLSDTGLGREMHSVIGQGKVEEILLSKPHERRRFVEEAAGLGKYQRRRSRAEAKLTRVEVELERARDLEREVRARLRPLAMQATAAERASKLGAEIALGRVALLSSELLGERERVADLRGRLAGAVGGQTEVEAAAKAIAARREAAERELAGLSASRSEPRGRSSRSSRRASGWWRTPAAWRHRWRASSAAAGRRRVEAGELQRLAARAGDDATVADAAAGELEAEAAGIGQGEVQAADAAAAQAEAALAAALGARRDHADAEGQAANARRELEAAMARSAELGERLQALSERSAASTEQLRAADDEANALGGKLDAARVEMADTEGRAQALEAEAETAREAERAARTEAAAAVDAEQLAAARLQALEAAVDRGEGLSASARALQERGARLVVEGIEAAPGYERAVAAALGWRAGAVVAERIDEAIGMVGQADGDLAVLLAGRAPDHAPSDAGRPLTEVCTVRDASLQPLVEGIRLVDDLAAVKHGVAVTADGTGIDADRGELWRTADAAESAWMAARAERDRLRESITDLAGERERLAAAAGVAAARLDETLASEAEVRRTLTEARRDETALAQAQRTAVARRDQLADELARCDASRDLAERDLETEAARLTELRALSSGFAAVVAERRAAATEADERHSALDTDPATAGGAGGRRGGAACGDHRAGGAAPRRRGAGTVRRRALDAAGRQARGQRRPCRGAGARTGSA